MHSMTCSNCALGSVLIDWYQNQAANLRGFRASVHPKFEGRIPDIMDGIPILLKNSIFFIVVNVHRKKSLVESKVEILIFNV